MTKQNFQYNETCPECDSWDLMFFNTREEDGILHFSATCRECGAEWKDYIEIGN